jgi:sarcosine/dimethylglycine N-methyltransferase
MTTAKDDQTVKMHYGRGDLYRRILNGLQAAGKNPEQLEPNDLTPVDQFHIGGKDATLQLMHLVGVQPGMEVLDVGGGLGGPARMLAVEATCRVTVLDLTEEYCRVGEMLTVRTGLSNHVSFQQGNVLQMPFADDHFDVVWKQHCSMNIAEKEQLYTQIHRVLHPTGRLALHEILAGAVQPLHFPVPWARDPALSHLRQASELRQLLARLGFKELVWIDVSGPSLAWYRERLAATSTQAGPPPLGLHLLLPDFGQMLPNLVRNLEEDRMVVVQAVFERL